MTVQEFYNVKDKQFDFADASVKIMIRHHFLDYCVFYYNHSAVW